MCQLYKKSQPAQESTFCWNTLDPYDQWVALAVTGAKGLLQMSWFICTSFRGKSLCRTELSLVRWGLRERVESVALATPYLPLHYANVVNSSELDSIRGNHSTPYRIRSYFLCLRPACSTSRQGHTCTFSQGILITCFYGNKFIATYSFQPVPDVPHSLWKCSIRSLLHKSKEIRGVSEKKKLSFQFPFSREKK